VLLALRALLPTAFAVDTGVLVGAVQHGSSLVGPLVATGIVFVGLQILRPVQVVVGQNLGDTTGASLNDGLAVACVVPDGVAHLEDPELTSDLTVARDFDLGIQGPPLSVAMEFIGDGIAQLLAGLASAVLVAFWAWWAGLLVAVAWLSTHWLLRESAVWKDRNTPEVRSAQRDSDYAYRLAVDPPAAKELRLFGLAGWTIERFADRRRLLHRLQYDATRLRERSVVWCLLAVLGANTLVFWLMADAASDGRLDLARVVVFAQAVVGTSAIAFGGLSWALDGAASAVTAVSRLGAGMSRVGALADRSAAARPAEGMPQVEIRFDGVRFAYPGTATPVLDGFDLTIEAGTSLAIVGQNGAGKTTLAKLLCRLYDPVDGAIRVDGVDLRDLDLASWRSRMTAVFQDFVRLEKSLRENVAPGGASDEDVRAALVAAGADHLADLDTVLARGYDGGTDLSGGQWQRVALARALCAVRQGAGLIVLDEPTAQLDVRGEAEIFGRILQATRGRTTILVSHRFSTVRQADRICVLERGRVVELGSHDELIAIGGRYRTMFDLQASRFGASEDEEGVAYDVLA
jgi:ATP-binding cassette subfamily B protein